MIAKCLTKACLKACIPAAMRYPFVGKSDVSCLLLVSSGRTASRFDSLILLQQGAQPLSSNSNSKST